MVDEDMYYSVADKHMLFGTVYPLIAPVLESLPW